MSISTTIKSIQDIMRKDVGVDGDAQRIGKLVWMLFLKIYDDKELEWELTQSRYRSPIPEKLRWRNWAADPEGMTGDTLLNFCDNELFPTLKELSVGTSRPICCSSPRAIRKRQDRLATSGTTSIRIHQVRSHTTRPSRSTSPSSRRKRSGGASPIHEAVSRDAR